jgi:hypothetical protein
MSNFILFFIGWIYTNHFNFKKHFGGWSIMLKGYYHRVSNAALITGV